MSGWVLPEEVLRDAPSYTPRLAELAELQLLVSGAYAPLTGFATQADIASVTRRGALADGTAWPVPVTLELPAGLAQRLDPANPLRRVVILTDPEGAPIAALDAVDLWPTRDGWFGVGGPVRAVGDGTQGPFQQLRRSPAAVRELLPPGRVLGVFADRPLHRPQLAQLAHAARTIQGHLLVMVPVSGPSTDGLSAEALVRSVLAARDRMPPATIVAIPLARRGNELFDALLRSRIAEAYGATHLLSTGESFAGGGPRVMVPRDLAYDSRDGQWRGVDDIPPRFRRNPLSQDELHDLLDRGITLPEWHTPPAVARQLALDRPSRRHRGLVLFFTGFSGSGKSTIARGVADAVLESGERTVTMLDGDIVRRELSAGLTFSRPDREMNIRRIGWVAGEVGRHGGLAIACPIAPYDSGRAHARALAVAAGADFVLVWVNTPLEECERRDRKGLYAKARAGELKGMTGIDDPYEEPTDAELVIDTSEIPIDDGVQAVLAYLGDTGWLEPRETSD